MFNFKYEKCATFKYEKCSILKYEKRGISNTKYVLFLNKGNVCRSYKYINTNVTYFRQTAPHKNCLSWGSRNSFPFVNYRPSF